MRNSVFIPNIIFLCYFGTIDSIKFSSTANFLGWIRYCIDTDLSNTIKKNCLSTGIGYLPKFYLFLTSHQIWRNFDHLVHYIWSHLRAIRLESSLPGPNNMAFTRWWSEIRRLQLRYVLSTSNHVTSLLMNKS